MALENKFRMKLYVKDTLNKFIPTVTANDNTVFEFEVFDGADRVELLDTYRFIFVTKATGKDSVMRDAVLNAEGLVEVVLGYSETKYAGTIDCALQIYDENDKRISTMRMKVNVKGDMALMGGLPAEDSTLVIADEAQLTRAVSVADEVEEARGGEANIGVRLDSVSTQLAGSVQQLSRTVKYPPVVATRSSCYKSGLSNGTDQAVTYRIRHVATKNAFDLQLVYGNFTPTISSGEADGPNDINVKASIEYNSIIFPVLFNGKSQVTINPGGIVVSDPVGIDIAATTPFYTRTFVSVASAGQKWPTGITSVTGNNEGKTAGDLTAGGTTTNTFEFCYSPMAILGATTEISPTILNIGDSIMQGQGDTTQDTGFMIRALNNKFGYVAMAMPGEFASNFQGLGRRNRFKLAKYGTHAVVEYGINDFKAGSSFETVKNHLLNIWQTLANRGIKVYQTTITPVTTSTDSWATVENQTITPSNAARVQLNNWIRTVPAPLSGYFETADKVETARDSGVWKAAYTNDGTHPNSTGYTEMAKAIDTSFFSV